MKFIGALIVGIATGVAAIFLHHFAPPFGIVVAIAGTFVAIWSIGRSLGKRFYKMLAAISWFAIFLRGGSIGVGNEIFVQGDRLGNIFLLSAFIAIFIAIALPTD